jgi:hypothetical protein
MIDPTLHHRLICWGRWCSRRLELPAGYRCGSAEHLHVPWAGLIYQTATEALERSLRHMPPPEQPMIEVEIAVMRLRPVKLRTVLRLDYTAGKRLSLQQKAVLAGCYPQAFLGLVEQAAGRLGL